MNDFLFPPVRPEIMNQVVASLSLEQIESLPAIVREYEKKMDEWRSKNQQTAEEKISAIRESVEKELGFSGASWADTVWGQAIENTPALFKGASTEALMTLKSRYKEYAKISILTNGTGRGIVTN